MLIQLGAGNGFYIIYRDGVAILEIEDHSDALKIAQALCKNAEDLTN